MKLMHVVILYLPVNQQHINRKKGEETFPMGRPKDAPFYASNSARCNREIINLCMCRELIP